MYVGLAINYCGNTKGKLNVWKECIVHDFEERGYVADGLKRRLYITYCQIY